MNSFSAGMEELANQTKEYINLRVDMLKLKTAEKSSGIIAAFIAITVVAMIFLVFLLFISIALAYQLSAWLNWLPGGFLIVGGIYLVAGIIIWVGREKLIRMPVMNQILAQLFKDDASNEKTV